MVPADSAIGRNSRSDVIAISTRAGRPRGEVISDPAVRRPARLVVVAGPVGDRNPGPTRRRHDVDGRNVTLPAVDRHEADPALVRRPGRIPLHAGSMVSWRSSVRSTFGRCCRVMYQAAAAPAIRMIKEAAGVSPGTQPESGHLSRRDGSFPPSVVPALSRPSRRGGPIAEDRDVAAARCSLYDGVWPDETKQIRPDMYNPPPQRGLSRAPRARKCRRSGLGIPVFLLCEIRPVLRDLAVGRKPMGAGSRLMRRVSRAMRPPAAILIALVMSAVVPVFVQPAGPQGPPVAAPAGGQTPPAPGAGRGRVFDPMPDYPANPNDVIQALNGFKVEVVAKADRPKQGSWISITEDDQGRLILGANEQQPFTRLTLDKAGKVVKTETIFTPVSEAMGITWHDNALYVQGGPAREAIHRDDGQPRVRQAERAGGTASPARSEGRRQLHDHRHAAHVGRPRGRPQRPRDP